MLGCAKGVERQTPTLILNTSTPIPVAFTEYRSTAGIQVRTLSERSER